MHEDSSSILSNENFELAERIRQAERRDKTDPAVLSTAYFAKKWIDQGWNATLIVATIERVMSKRDKAPGNLKYFENAIADAHAEFARPLPVGTAASQPRRTHKKTFVELAVEMEALVDAQAAADSTNLTVVKGETGDRLRDQPP